MKKKITVTYFIEDRFDEYDFRCAQKASEMNSAIWDALNKIRSRLKHCDDVSEAEEAFLEDLRGLLGDAHVEEQ